MGLIEVIAVVVNSGRFRLPLFQNCKDQRHESVI